MKHFSSPYFKINDLKTGVKEIIFSRKEVKNALNADMIADLTSLFQKIAQVSNPHELRVVVLNGEGDVFSAGADLNYMREQAEKSFEENLEDANLLGELFFTLTSIPCPVISAVKGAAIGGGLGICVCSDFVLAEKKARFATSEVKLGIVPAVIGPYIIRKIGVSHASHLMLTGSLIDTNKAEQIGLINQITTAEEFEKSLSDVIDSFLMAGPNAARLTKELIQRTSPLPDPVLFEFTAQRIALARSSKEGKQGLECFFSKSKPNWCP